LLNLIVVYFTNQIFRPQCYLSSPPRLDCHVYFLSLLNLIVVYFILDAICPLLIGFDRRLYFTNLIFCPWWYPPSPPWLDCSVYLGPNPIHPSSSNLIVV
jgi:hypothetical protein